MVDKPTDMLLSCVTMCDKKNQYSGKSTSTSYAT